jgi:acetoin utilization protein AcuB
MHDSHHDTPREPKRPATVRHAMRPAVTTVELHAHVAAAAYLMRRAHATALVVTTNDANRRPIAIITETDIAQAVADGRDVNETRIDELVGPQPITVHPATAVSNAIALMVSAGIRHLPVVEYGHLIGMLDIADAYRAVSGPHAPAHR